MHVFLFIIKYYYYFLRITGRVGERTGTPRPAAKKVGDTESRYYVVVYSKFCLSSLQLLVHRVRKPGKSLREQPKLRPLRESDTGSAYPYYSLYHYIY